MDKVCKNCGHWIEPYYKYKEEYTTGKCTLHQMFIGAYGHCEKFESKVVHLKEMLAEEMEKSNGSDELIDELKEKIDKRTSEDKYIPLEEINNTFMNHIDAPMRMETYSYDELKAVLVCLWDELKMSAREKC